MRDVEEEFSEYVRYMLRPLVHLFLSMSLFLNLLFEQIANSNEYLLVKFGVDTEENEPCKVCSFG